MKLLKFGKEKAALAVAKKQVEVKADAGKLFPITNTKNTKDVQADAGSLSPITKEERDFLLEKTNQQRYAIEVRGAQEDLRKSAAIAAAKHVKANTAEVKVQTAIERHKQAVHGLEAAQIDTQRTALQPGNAQAKLGSAQSQTDLLQVKSQVKAQLNQLKQRNFKLLRGNEQG
jgi:hypothetical protein